MNRRLESALLHGFAFPFGAHVRAAPGAPAVGLTFDDGPDHDLHYFLELLAESEVRATFFVVGEQVEKHPGGLREIVAGGHEVGVHGYRHLPYPRRHAFDAVEDLYRAMSAIQDVGGIRPRLFRPPYGRFSRAVARAASEEGLEKLLWSRTGFDWKAKATPESVASHIGWPERGDLVLLHDSERYAEKGARKSTLGALPTIMERVKGAGLEFRTVGEMLGS